MMHHLKLMFHGTTYETVYLNLNIQRQKFSQDSQYFLFHIFLETLRRDIHRSLALNF